MYESKGRVKYGGGKDSTEFAIHLILSGKPK